MMNAIYLDGFATLPLAPEAKEAMLSAWTNPGNTGSANLAGGVRAREDRIDCGIVDAGQIFDVVGNVPLPVRVDRDRRPNNSGRLCLAPAARPDLRGFPQGADAVGRERRIWGLAGDPPTSAQHVAGDCQLMGGCANIFRGVMEDEISRWTSSPSIHNEAQASANCILSIQPVPTGERAIRSSRRARAIPASKAVASDHSC